MATMNGSTFAFPFTVLVLAASGGAPVATPSPAPRPSYAITIVATGSMNDGVPLVTGIVNQRVPSAPVRLSVRVEPGAPNDTVVRWSSPDRKNELGADFFVVGHSDLTWNNTLGDSTIGVFERDGASGKAIVVADIGPPVNARATITVFDGAGIGFGCYGFMPQGPSVRFVDGVPKKSTLSDADVAVVGPATLATAQDGSKVPLGPGPWYGCWGRKRRSRRTRVRPAVHVWREDRRRHLQPLPAI